MVLTRRAFLGCAAGAGAVAMRLPLDASRDRGTRLAPAAPDSSDAPVAYTLVDLGERCAFPESLAGWAAALPTARVHRLPDESDDAGAPPRCSVLIVPAALAISTPLARAITHAARRGATVLLESGAAFADADDFCAHRDALRRELHVDVHPPVSLWPARSVAHPMPYVDYGWPVAARVRDFSRAVPVRRSHAGDELIAHIGSLPVALRRRIGRGTLIFLGSPLGPALRAGDAEARGWLDEACSRSG